MDLFKTALNLLFPPVCAGCSKIIANGCFCDDCLKDLENFAVDEGFCYRCGLPEKLCLCGVTDIRYDRMIAAYYYESTVRKALLNAKFHSDSPAFEYFSGVLSQQISNHSVNRYDLTVCVPMTEHEKEKRGFNQSELLAKNLAKRLELEFRPEIMVKLYDTKPQHKIETKQKAGNVLGVFDTDGTSINNLDILLVDDISTTRSTLNECAKILKIRGAKSVTCAVAAVTEFDYREKEREIKKDELR